jgi:hypothetical protein
MKIKIFYDIHFSKVNLTINGKKIFIMLIIIIINFGRMENYKILRRVNHNDSKNANDDRSTSAGEKFGMK